MKNTILISVLVGALAGASSSLMTSAFVSTASPGDEGARSLEGLNPPQPGDAEGIMEQLIALRRQGDELAMRLTALESARAGRAREVVAGAESEDYAQLQQDIADLAAALKNPQSAQAAGLRNSVRFAMEQLREEENAEREREREGRDIARIDERLAELQSKLGLDQVQMKSMREVLLTESTKRTELFQEMRGGGMDRQTIRAAMGELRDETKASLSNILTPMQLEDYAELDNGGRFGGRGDGGGRGGREGRRP